MFRRHDQVLTPGFWLLAAAAASMTGSLRAEAEGIQAPTASTAEATAGAGTGTAAQADAPSPTPAQTSAASTADGAPDSGASGSSSDATPETKVERVEVTGSHIRRTTVEGAAPVQTVTRKELEKSGYNSVSDVLRDAAVNS